MELLDIFSMEDQILFACTRKELHEIHRQKVIDICCRKKVCWDIVLKTAVAHGVETLVSGNLLKCVTNDCMIPIEVFDRFKLYTAINVVRLEKRKKKIAELISFLNSKSFDVMLIKGEAINFLVYEQPINVISGDIDLMIRYRGGNITDKYKREILNYVARDPWVECDYFRHHDIDLGGVLPVNFQRIWDNAIKVEYMGQKVFVMSPENLLLAACINCCRKRFFRLKSLSDIAEIINKYAKLNWKEFIEMAKEYKCSNIIYTALLITKMTLGCNLPDYVLDKLKGHWLRTAVIHFLIPRICLGSHLLYLYPYFKRNARTKNKFVVNVDFSLLLPYATYLWSQLWPKMKTNWSYTWRTIKR